MKKKILQVPVVIGSGTSQFFIEKDIIISPPSPPVYRIEKIDKWVEVISMSVIPGKVLFNAFLWKNITYKTVEDVCNGIVNGPIYHSTLKIPFGGFVEIDPVGCEKVKACDVAELLEACVEGEKDFLHDECYVKGEKVYNALLEKVVVRLTFKVVRIEHLPVEIDYDKDDKDDKDDKCGKDKYEKEEKCNKGGYCDKEYEKDCKPWDKDEDKYGYKYFKKYID